MAAHCADNLHRGAATLSERTPAPAINDLFDINLVLAAALAVWCVGIRRWRGPWVLVGIQLALSLLTELLAMHACGEGIPNAAYYNAYLPIEFILLLLIARTYLRLPRPYASVALVGAIYLFFFILEVHGYGGMGTLAVRTVVCGALFLSVLYTFLLFRLSEDIERPLVGRPSFWLFLSFIVYFGIMIPVIGLHNYLSTRYPDVDDRVYLINEILFVLRYALVTVALVLKLRMPRP